MTATEEQVAATVIAAINAVDASTAYDLDDAKKLDPIPAGYVEVMVSPRFGAPLRNPGSTGRRGWRISTRQVGNFVSNARSMREHTHAALQFARLTIAGEQTTPIQFEGAEPIGEDDGYWSGLETWTFAI